MVNIPSKVANRLTVGIKRFQPVLLSAPLITTLVDATGLIIYFSIAKVILHL